MAPSQRSSRWDSPASMNVDMRRLMSDTARPRELSPLPVLGIPGWWPDNERADFYDNTDYFRSGRRTEDAAAGDAEDTSLNAKDARDAKEKPDDS